MNETTHHLALVGAGASAAYTLFHYVALLKQSPPPRPVRIVVVEKSGEFWAGTPYGCRSGAHSLIITALKEFLPEPERREFCSWLDRNRARLCADGRIEGRSLTTGWYRENAAAMAAGRWDDIFLPRSWFGAYLQQTTAAVLNEAVQCGLIECVLLAGEVTDLERRDGRFHLRVTGGPADRQVIVADRVVMALGSPPNRPVGCGGWERAGVELCLVENPYELGLDQQMDRVAAALIEARGSGRDQVLVIGSNASALEALYQLADRQDLSTRIGRFLVVTPTGRFPHRIGGGGVPAGYRAAQLEALVVAGPITASQIYDALREDVARAEQQGICVADVFQTMSRCVVEALNRLDPEEQQRFVTDTGVRLGKLQHRAGPEYSDAVARLVNEGRLEVLRGKLVDYVPMSAGGPGFEYLETETGARRRRLAPLAALINCGGFVDLPDWSSPLIQNLLRRGLCRPNASRRGFVINEDFEMSPGCYLMGPLVAGNLNRAVRVWHAESCSRIIGLSKQLAEALMRPATG